MLSTDRWRARPGPAVALTDHLGEEIHPTAEISFVAEIKLTTAIARAAAPNHKLIGKSQTVRICDIICNSRPFLDGGQTVLGSAGSHGTVHSLEESPEFLVQRHHEPEIEQAEASVFQ